MAPNFDSATAQFPDCSAEAVFSEVTKQISASDERAVWTRMQSEIRRQGVPAVTDYVESEFTRIREELSKELANFQVG